MKLTKNDFKPQAAYCLDHLFGEGSFTIMFLRDSLDYDHNDEDDDDDV